MLTKQDPPPRIREVTLHPTKAKESPAAQVQEMQARVEAIRADLGVLIGELDRRRRRAGKVLARGVAALAVLGLGGYVLWRLLRASP